jgi:membrane complex biogenesis BtpA family protein
MDVIDLFGVAKPVIAMLHVPALPGSPQSALSFHEVLDWVLSDAEKLASAGVHGWILENFGDAPFFPRSVPPHTVAFLTAIGCELKRRFSLALGINVLRNDAVSAVAVACAVGAEFIRVNIHTGARLTDQGLIEGLAHETLRYRKMLGRDVKIFADVDVKHSAPVAARDLKDEVEELVSRGCADAVIASGTGTGKPTDLGHLKTAKQAAGPAPVFAGSGVDAANLNAVLNIADGVIVGTALKKDGVTTNPVDTERVLTLMQSRRLHG